MTPRVLALALAGLLLAACGEQPAEADIASAVAQASAERYAREMAAMNEAIGPKAAAAVAGAPPEIAGLRKRRCREVTLGTGVEPATGFECAVSLRFRNDGWIEKTFVVAHGHAGWRIVE